MRRDTENDIYLSSDRRRLKLNICIAAAFVCVSDLYLGGDNCACEAGIGNWTFQEEQCFIRFLARD